MESRRVIAVLLIAGLFGSGPALAVEAAVEDGAELSTAQAAVAASSAVAAPVVVRGLELQRPDFVVAAVTLPAHTWERPPVTPVLPYVHAARPDVVTAPSQGPPAGAR